MKAAEPLGNDEAEEAVIQRKGPLIQSYQSENNRLEHGPMIPHIYGFVNRNRPWIRDYYKKRGSACALPFPNDTLLMKNLIGPC